ncbi:neuronal acetylcholine receptor subunit alpha-3 [Plakobranchus ocellatus]|uniref:Neuronal acetylcholine receptor subunit alpha-3 n=1 Tax=Plakobranchus ocellatus TaxID=259542 RepID=A0AAV3XYD3_9GAST|nr:neuronal acetylcholine receptor subunit alpha-3 [Plakobranchus ocellatus]
MCRLQVSEKEQILVTNTRLFMSWSDAYLSWDPSMYGNISSILLSQSSIWLPDITVHNTVEPNKQMGFYEMPCRVYSTGKIEWNPGAIIYTSCPIDVTYFPMDSQFPIVLDKYKRNGQWDLVDSWASQEEGKKTPNKITFYLLLKRRQTYYILNILIPVLLLSFTGTLALALPAEAGEKMGMCLTVLLAYSVYLTIVSEELPNTSLQVSLLSVYLAILIAITAATVIMTVCILRLYHRDETEQVGPMTEKLTRFLQKITCTAKGKKPHKNSVTPLFVQSQLSEVELTDPDKAQSQNTISTNLSFERSNSAQTIERLTWQEVAKTLDCFLFILMSGISLVCTLCFVFVLLVGSEKNAPTSSSNRYEYSDL